MKKETILVVSPHPDDETLGAGGYILKQKQLSKQVFVLNMTHMKEDYGYSSEIIHKRNLEINKMINTYNLDDYFNLNLQPAGLDTYKKSELIAQISTIINKIQPTTIVLPYRYDVHSDHRITFDLCYSCTKNFRYPFIKKILMMEIMSETEYAYNLFKPNYFVDITEFVDKKIEIIKVFESEIGEHPFPRSEGSIRANNMVRGSMVGVDYAEAFMLLKFIE